MADLLDRRRAQVPAPERDAALAKIGRENFRKYVTRAAGRLREMVVDKDVERVAPRLRPDDARGRVDRVPLRDPRAGDRRASRCLRFDAAGRRSCSAC